MAKTQENTIRVVFAFIMRFSIAVLFFLAIASETKETGENDVAFRHEFSFSPPFWKHGLVAIRGWRFSGSAVVTDSYVRLTPSISVSKIISI